MYKLCKTEESAQRQRQLEMGLLSAMENAHYEEISISDLCHQMKIPRKSFYRYFSSKEGALYALLDHTFLEYDRSEALLKGETSYRRRKDLERFFDFWLMQRRLLDVLERSGLSGVFMGRAIHYAVNEHGGPVSTFPQNETFLHNQAVTFITCGLMSMMLQWHHAGYNRTPREMAELATIILSRPLLSP